jgi:hypothetical protein
VCFYRNTHKHTQTHTGNRVGKTREWNVFTHTHTHTHKHTHRNRFGKTCLDVATEWKHEEVDEL